MDYDIFLSQFCTSLKVVSRQRRIMKKRICEGMEQKLKDRMKCMWMYLKQVITDKTHLFQINHLWLREIL